MYLEKNNLSAHCIPEKGGFLAYINLGSDANGKRVRPKVRGKTEAEAIAKLEKKLIELGYIPPEADAPKLDMFMSEHTSIPDAVKEYRVNGIVTRTDEKEITSRTGENYVYMIKPFEQYFANLTLGDITVKHINQFMRAMEVMKNKKGDYKYAQVTLNRIAYVTYKLFQRAHTHQWIAENPFDSPAYKRPRSKKSSKPIEGLDPDELTTVLSILKSNRLIYTPISLMLQSGMRTQEVLALQWKHIDFEANVISIQQAITVDVQFDDEGNISSRKSILGNPKTQGSTRQIGLTAEAKAMLLEWRAVAPTITQTDVSVEGFVFGYEKKRSYTYHAFRDRVNDYLTGQENGIDSIRLHRLRHTVGTLLAAEGREILQIMRQLGITQEKTLQRYIDKKGNQKIMDGNVQAIQKGLSGIIGKKEDHGDNAENATLQALLKEAESVTDSKAKEIISCLLEMVQDGKDEIVAQGLAQKRM